MTTVGGIVVSVGISEIRVLKNAGQMSCQGVGSGVVICALDPIAHIAAMVHTIIPSMAPQSTPDCPGRFADTAFEALLQQLEHAGADRSRVRIALVGGARPFGFAVTPDSRLDIGARNVASIESQIATNGLRCVASDTGGNQGRSVSFSAETGVVKVRATGQGEMELCSLRA